MNNWAQIDEKWIAERLAGWGYLPVREATEKVAPDELEKAVAEYQEFHFDWIDQECQAIHGRPLNIDGDAGLATLLVMSQPRCGCVDRATAEEANWPSDCRLQITVSYDLDRLNVSRETVAAAWRLALSSWERVIRVKFEIQETFSRSTRIWATAGPLRGSTLAWSMLAQNSCRSRLEQRYDTTTSWNLKFLQSTICHEVGHALGSGHLSTRSAIMYPSITNLVVPQGPDIRAMVRLGYAENTDPPEPPPEPPPVPDQITGVLRDSAGNEFIAAIVRA